MSLLLLARKFSDSYALDSKEAPLLLYHGVNATFDKIGPVDGVICGLVGARFSDLIGVARTFSPRIITAHLLLHNPYVVDKEEGDDGDCLTLAQAQQSGYDGYIVREGGRNTYSAFSPKQIYVIGDSKLTPEQRVSGWGELGQ